MKKFVLLGVVSAVVLMGAGCSQEKNDFVFEPEPQVNQKPPVAEVQPENKFATPDSIAPSNTEVIASKTPRERGVVRIKVNSAKTKLPVSGVIIVTEGMSGAETVKKTNLEGWVEFPQTWGNVYIPKMGGYKFSEVVNTMDGDKDGNITLLLEADVISGTVKGN